MHPPVARVLVLLLLMSAIGSADARSRHHRGGGGQSAEPGDFDYYLLALSWSPEFCATPAGHQPDKKAQCDQPRGFVVHGLWPQNERGYPQDCGPGSHVPADAAAPALTADPPMPPGDPGLLDHEWSKHGTCSGLGMPDYFRTIKTAAERVKIPAEFRQAQRISGADPALVKARFVAANPGLTEDMLQVIANREGDLQEVRVCLDKDIRFRPCSQPR
ncbi:MAG: ribonuclease T [Methylococcaceae bacterium]|nr:ribonuclease T [Methylococcaceae bacterium]